MAEYGTGIRASDVLRDAWAAAQSRRNLVLTVIAVGTFAGVGIDVSLGSSEAAAASGLFGLVSLYLQLLVTAASLGVFNMLPARFDPRRPTLGRYPAAFGLSFLYLLGVGVGLVLLVLPGLILIIRWSVSLPAMVAEDMGIVEALRRSWHLTAGKWQVTLQICGLGFAAYLVSLALLLLTYPDYIRPAWPAALAANLAFSVAFVFFWLLATALYRRLTVFAQPA